MHALCKRWAAAGHHVTVITSAPNVPNGVLYPGYKNRLWQCSILDGVNVVRVWTHLAPNKGTVRRIANYVSYMITAAFAGLLVRKPDVVLATSPQFFCGWAGVIVSKLRRLPFILEIRDLWPESIKVVGAMRRGSLLSFLEWMEHKMYSSADRIVTVGQGYCRQLCGRGVPAEKIGVVMNGVDRELFGPGISGMSTKERHGLNGCFVCSYIGTVGMACGLQVVLRAAAKLKSNPRIRFLIVGDGALLETLKEDAARAGLDNVVFAGRQPKEAIPQYLAASDTCLVHLKKQELFTSVMPSKIFETLAMGRSVILGVEGFAAEFIRKSGGGVCIEPENEDQLVSAIHDFVAAPDKAEAMGRVGREYVLSHFDRDVLAAEYVQQIEQVLLEASPPASARRRAPVQTLNL